MDILIVVFVLVFAVIVALVVSDYLECRDAHKRGEKCTSDYGW